MPRFAAIDIGSNSVRMEVAEISTKTRVLVSERKVTRLGASVFRTGRVSPEAIDFLSATLSEMAMVWAASQTEARAMPLVLLGDCWPPVIKAICESLVVSDGDMNLLRFAANPAAAVREIQAGLQNKRVGSGPRG